MPVFHHLAAGAPTFATATNLLTINSTGTNRLPLILLIAWFGLNLLQAAFTPLDADETYYWMYASQLDWGYFDHPPAVAVLIKLGMDWLPGTLAVRFGHVIASTLTMAGMWLLLERPRGAWLWLAAALVFAQPFLNVYGFIATPDGPLLLFTVLYLLAYRRFLSAPNVVNGAFWGLTMAGLLYSKYHGVMLIFFSVLPHLFWLLRQPGAWIAALGGATLYLPHLYWQFANDYPSFRYHLKGRNDAYQFKYTTEYLLNQLVIFSPLLVWYFGKMLFHFRSLLWTTKQGDTLAGAQVQNDTDAATWADRAFLRANYWLIAGFLLFFLYSTTKGGTEAQWTALLSMPLCYLTYRLVKDQFNDWATTIRKLGVATIIILLIARLLLIAPREWVPFDKPFDHQPWVERLNDQANGLPVMVQNSYRFSSLYEFYAGQPAWTFTDVQYRQNQYDLWQGDSIYHNKSVLLLGQGSWNNPQANAFRTQKRNMLTEKIDSFQVMKGLTLTPLLPAVTTGDQVFPDTIKRGELYTLELQATTLLSLKLDAGNLPITPFITVHYAEEEMRFWELKRGQVTNFLPAGGSTTVFSGQFRTYHDAPLGPAEVEFGLAYKGMPPIRGQSARYPVVIVE